MGEEKIELLPILAQFSFLQPQNSVKGLQALG